MDWEEDWLEEFEQEQEEEQQEPTILRSTELQIDLTEQEEEWEQRQKPHVPNPPLPVKPVKKVTKRQTAKKTKVATKTGPPKIIPEKPLPRELIRQNASTNIRSDVKVKSFRINSKTIFLTFPQYEGTMDHIQMMAKVKQFVTNKLRRCLIEAIVCKEAHKKGEDGEEMGVHFHIACKLDRAVNVINPNYFDELTGKHGDYRSCKNWNNALVYCAKTGPSNYVTFPEDLDVKAIENAVKGKKDTTFIRFANKIQAGETIKEINEENPGFVMQHSKKILEYQRLVETFKEKKLPEWPSVVVPLFKKHKHNTEIAKWLNENIKRERVHKQRQLYIWGPTNMRKTSMIFELEKYLKVYWVPDDNDWYDGYNDSYDLIVFDEFVGQKPIHFMNGISEGKPFPMRQRNLAPIMKRKNIPIIVLSNVSITELYQEQRNKSENKMKIEAFEKRFLAVEVNSPISINFQDQKSFSDSKENSKKRKTTENTGEEENEIDLK